MSLRPAVGMEVLTPRDDPGWWKVHTVPEDGILAFPCPTGRLKGKGRVPGTLLVEGPREVFPYRQLATPNHCGEMIFTHIGDPTKVYLPWRYLNLAADTLTRHFGHTREPVKWEVTDAYGYGAAYRPYEDKIVLGYNLYDPKALFVVAHEYGHALHHKALGGVWPYGPPRNCNPHYFHVPSSYECALLEGFAHYAGTVGSGGHFEDCFEHFGTPRAPEDPPWCRSVPHERKPEIEGWVAALFMDLVDDTWEKRDWTEYPGLYVAEVLKSCEVKAKHWRKRTKVSDIVWCLERRVDQPVHREAFPNTDVPDSVREDAVEPPNWKGIHIRSTWSLNLK